MNHMYEVAKFLGVELYEAFTITFPPPSTHHAVVMLTEAGAKVIDTDVFDVLNFNSYLLERLIKGTTALNAYVVNIGNLSLMISIILLA